LIFPQRKAPKPSGEYLVLSWSLLLGHEKEEKGEKMDLSLPEINEHLVSLPGHIAEKKIKMEMAKSNLDYESSKIILSLDKREYSNSDLRLAVVNSSEKILKLKEIYIQAEAKYFEDINFFNGIIERSRNVRAEIKSLNDSA